MLGNSEIFICNCAGLKESSVWHLGVLFFLQEWGVTRLTFEYDSEPFGKERDAAIIKLAKEAGVEVVIENSHTLYDLDRYGERKGRGAAWARLGLSCLQRLQSPLLHWSLPSWVSLQGLLCTLALLIRTRQSADSDVNVQKGVASSLLNSVLDCHLICSAVSYWLLSLSMSSMYGLLFFASL